MSDVLRFEIGTATEFVAPNGKRYLRGTFEGLCFTAYPDPEREPADGGIARWVVIASPAPGKAKHVHVPPIVGAPARESSIKPATKAELLRAAAADVIARHGPIPPGGDTLDGAFLPLLDPELAEAMRALETPLA